MNQAFPDALVEGYEHRIEELTLKDFDDRHVLAAALEVNADYLVTANLRDFQEASSQPIEIQVIHPDTFISQLIANDTEAVTRSLEKLVSRLKNPPQSKATVINTLEKCGLIETAWQLRS